MWQKLLFRSNKSSSKCIMYIQIHLCLTMTFIKVTKRRRQILHKKAQILMPHDHPKGPLAIKFCINSFTQQHTTQGTFGEHTHAYTHTHTQIQVHAHTHTHTNTHPLGSTHPMRETICSTMCLLKVTITNSFCMTKKGRERASQLLNHEVTAGVQNKGVSAS